MQFDVVTHQRVITHWFARCSDCFLSLLRSFIDSVLQNHVDVVLPSVCSNIISYWEHWRNRQFSYYSQPVCTTKSDIVACQPTKLYIRPTQNKTIISWQRPVTFPPTLFQLYRGATTEWHDARPVERPIFCGTNPQTMHIEYCCIDEIAHDEQMITYWLVAQHENVTQSHGPFVLQRYTVESFACVN